MVVPSTKDCKKREGLKLLAGPGMGDGRDANSFVASSGI